MPSNSVHHSNPVHSTDAIISSEPASTYADVPGSDRHQIVTFDDSDISNSTPARFGFMRGISSFMDEGKNHDIAAFLQRPQRLASVTVTNATTDIGSFSIADLLSVPSVANKIAGFMYFTGDFHVKITVNANRFAYGRIIAAHTPYASTLAFNKTVKSSETPLLTTFPYVDCDIGSNESATLDVPFSSAYMWQGVPFANWSFSDVDVRMLSPFVGTTGAASCNVSVFGWIDNLQLAVPVPHGKSDHSAQEMSAKSTNLVRSSINAVHDISGA